MAFVLKVAVAKGENGLPPLPRPGQEEEPRVRAKEKRVRSRA